MKNKKILIVGGCGFIGHNLALKLKRSNYDVTVADSLAVNNLMSLNSFMSENEQETKNKKLYTAILNSRINLLNQNNIKLIIHDGRDYHGSSRLYNRTDPDIIVHLAAVSHANKSNKDPHSTFDHSLRTLENTLDIAKNKKTHVIYVSSSMVYGNFSNGEVKENAICKPIGIYGTLKLAGELIVKAYNQVFDLPYTIIRPSALYGERCISRRVGQIFIENAIQGLDVSLSGDGSDKLDFTYIEDLVSGIKLCCEEKKAINETFNITFGNSRKISEMADILKSEFPGINVIYKEKDKFMPERGTLNNDKAKKLLSFHPKHKLEEGYLQYITWYKNFWENIN